MKKLKHFFKVRITAMPYDIYDKRICKKGENDDYWIGYDNIIYFGSRFGIFIRSCINDLR
jgi:hypothetical protein